MEQWEFAEPSHQFCDCAIVFGESIGDACFSVEFGEVPEFGVPAEITKKSISDA